MANFGMVGVEWQERVNWDRMRKFRRNRARHMRKEYGRGSLVRAMSGAGERLRAVGIACYRSLGRIAVEFRVSRTASAAGRQ